MPNQTNQPTKIPPKQNRNKKKHPPKNTDEETENIPSVAK